MLSIITAFGCRYDCPGCIHFYKTMECYPTSFWTKAQWRVGLSVAMGAIRGSRFSISGGGDPMNMFDDNENFWWMIESVAKDRGMTYDVHTSYEEIFQRAIDKKKSTHTFVYPSENKEISFVTHHFERLNKVVFHLRHQFAPLPETKGIPTRFAYVITNKTTIDGLRRLEEEIPRYCQLAYRELMPCGDAEPASAEVDAFARGVEDRRAGARYVEQADYNVYLWPDGTLREKFLG